jgi:dihydrofolate reductase
MISIIVATDKKGAIGKDNALLWHLPNDLKRFKALTVGHPIIMGRKTFESIGRPLPGRTNIIITNNKELKIDGCVIVFSLKDAIVACEGKDAYIIGGGSIYEQSMEIADMIYLTLVDVELDADTHFPKIEDEKWQLVHSEMHTKDEKHQYDFQFIDFKRKF